MKRSKKREWCQEEMFWFHIQSFRFSESQGLGTLNIGTEPFESWKPECCKVVKISLNFNFSLISKKKKRFFPLRLGEIFFYSEPAVTVTVFLLVWAVISSMLELISTQFFLFHCFLVLADLHFHLMQLQTCPSHQLA